MRMASSKSCVSARAVLISANIVAQRLGLCVPAVYAAMNADILVAEAVTEKNIQYANWGGDTVEEKKKEIFRYHFSPAVLARIANEANVKTIVFSHEQNYNNGDDYDALGVVNEIIAAGFEGAIYSAMDADVY
jgi:ribonuclease Z